MTPSRPATASSRLATAIVVGILVLGRSADGQTPRPVPDITGSWQRLGATVGVKPTAKPDPKLQPPPAAQPVLKPQYQQERQQRIQAIREADAKGQPLANQNVYCLPDGMPAMMGAVFPMEILQSRGQITIIEEAYNQVRRILMDRPQKTLDDVELTFYGHSVGRWEGDTLVVDTIGIKENVRFQNAPHSAQMRIRERMRLMAPDVREKSGVWYRLNRWREEQMTAGKSLTYGDLVRQYIVLNRMPRFERVPHDRYINFVADFLEAEKAATRAEAIAAWKQLKELDVPKNYVSWLKAHANRNGRSR